MTTDLPIIQKTYDLILWYVPILNRLPRDHKFALGDRIVGGLYSLPLTLVASGPGVRGAGASRMPAAPEFTSGAAKEKLRRLEALNGRLDLLRYQTRLLKDLNLMEPKRYEHAARALVAIGTSLGGWIRQQQRRNTT